MHLRIFTPGSYRFSVGLMKPSISVVICSHGHKHSTLSMGVSSLCARVRLLGATRSYVLVAQGLQNRDLALHLVAQLAVVDDAASLAHGDLALHLRVPRDAAVPPPDVRECQ